MNGLDEYDEYEFRWKAEFARIRRAQLNSHPDCRDPEHPGCERCCDSETDEQEEDDQCAAF